MGGPNVAMLHDGLREPLVLSRPFFTIIRNRRSQASSSAVHFRNGLRNHSHGAAKQSRPLLMLSVALGRDAAHG
jgi:hypothetical protein